MKWRKTIPCCKDRLYQVKEEAVATLRTWGVPEDELFDCEIILCELLANGAEHGNGWREDSCIALQIRYYPSQGQLLFLVRDEGNQPIERKDWTQVEELSPRGRGLLLVESLSHRLTLGRGRVWVRKVL